jgi:rare lipoprotein A
VLCAFAVASALPAHARVTDHRALRHSARASKRVLLHHRTQLPLHARPVRVPVSEHTRPDLSGRRRVGVASFYANFFAGRPMANGVPMSPHGNNAASRTLPLGTVAKVTNLDTGKSAIVTIQDRGPYVEGRIVDLSPATARKIGITRRQGISRVAVAPVSVPLPDGTIKRGVAAHTPKPRRRRARSWRELLAEFDRR